jgi:hypothetical protein
VAGQRSFVIPINKRRGEKKTKVDFRKLTQTYTGQWKDMQSEKEIVLCTISSSARIWCCEKTGNTFWKQVP